MAKWPRQRDYPKEVAVGKLRYKVRFVRSLDRFGFDFAARGVCSHSEQAIFILQGLKPQLRYETLMHELLHVAEAAYGMKLSHATIEKLEEPLARLLLDNQPISISPKL